MNTDDNDDNEKVLREVADTKKAPGDPTKHAIVDPKEHISRKTYMFPESYNALRRELEANFPHLWRYVGGDMAWNPQRFIGKMDEALDCITQFDSGNVDGICKRYLDKLRNLRGLTPLHRASEYFNNTKMEEEVRLARNVHENQSPWKQ